MKKKFIISIITATFLLASFFIVGCNNEKENASKGQNTSSSDITSTQANSNVNNAQNVQSNKADNSKNKSSDETTDLSKANFSKEISNKKSNSSTETNDTNMVKGETVNSIYKPDISKTTLDEVKNNYYKNMETISTNFGNHFAKTGELIFSDNKEENENYTKEFYNMTDNMLNELWDGLKIILSDSEMKKLTQEELQWIKQKGSINKEGNEILTAKANTLYARGKETYERCLYLSHKYLNY